MEEIKESITENKENNEKENRQLSQIQEQLKRFQKNVMMGQNRYLLILCGILMLIIIGQGIHIGRMRRELNQINTSLVRLNNEIRDSRSYMYGMSGNIADEISHRMEEVNSEMESYSVKYTDINPSENTVTVKVNVRLKSYDNQSNYQVQIYNQQKDVVTFQNLEGEGLQRACLLMLPANADYSLDVMKTGDDGGARLTQESIFVTPKTELAERTKVESGSSFISDGKIERKFLLSNHTYEHMSALIAKVEAAIYYGDEAITNLPMTEVSLEDETSVMTGNSGTTSTTSQSVSVRSDNNTEPDILKPDVGEEVRMFMLSTTMEDLRSQLPTTVEDTISFHAFTVQLIVTYEDGSTMTLNDRLEL